MPHHATNIDFDKKFPHLKRAPIVEAAIHWSAHPQRRMDQVSWATLLDEKLSDYSRKVLHEVSITAMLSIPSPENKPSPAARQQEWEGFRLTSSDGRYVALLKRDGLVFSRVNGYDDFHEFTTAGKKVWDLFREATAPSEVQRLGVRFINRFPTVTPQNLHELLRDTPTCPADLPLKDFVYQSTFDLPGEPFGVRINKVIQPTMADVPESSGLFVDIDVFSTKAIASDSSTLETVLKKLRWLKNEVFFSILTKKAIQSFE